MTKINPSALAYTFAYLTDTTPVWCGLFIGAAAGAGPTISAQCRDNAHWNGAIALYVPSVKDELDKELHFLTHLSGSWIDRSPVELNVEMPVAVGCFKDSKGTALTADATGFEELIYQVVHTSIPYTFFQMRPR